MRRLALIAPLVLATAAAARGPGFWLVGAPTGMEGNAHAVSWDGSFAVGANSKTLSSVGFSWTSVGGRRDFGLEEGMPDFTPATAVNSDGGVIVGWFGENLKDPPYFTQHAYRWTGNGPLQDLGVLPNRTRSYAGGVSGDGIVVVGTCESSKFSDAFGEAFRWTEQKGMQGLGYLKNGGTLSQSLAISRDGGTIVGLSQSLGPSGDVEAFAWTESQGMKKLPELPGAPPSGWCKALAVNADGSVIVGTSDSSNGKGHPTRWVDGQVEDLYPDLEGVSAFAYAVDDSGDVVGGSIDGKTAFVWTPGSGLVHLDDYLAFHGLDLPANYRLEYVWAISGDGFTFTGAARNLATNDVEGFVATVPSPGAVEVIVLPPLLRRRRRRRG